MLTKIRNLLSRRSLRSFSLALVFALPADVQQERPPNRSPQIPRKPWPAQLSAPQRPRDSTPECQLTRQRGV